MSRELLEKLRLVQRDITGTSRFAGLPPEERGSLAAEVLETPRRTPIEVAGQAALGALHAVGDIPAGIGQIASRYLPLPERTRAALERRISEYERTKRSVLAQPGGEAGYFGGQIGTAFIPLTGPAKVAGLLGKAVTVAKPIAVGTGLTAIRPYEEEGARAKAAIESAAYGAAGAGIIGSLGIAGKAAKRAFTGGEVIEATGERASRASVANKLGYKLTLGEASGNTRLRYIEDASEKMLGGTLFAKLRAANKENTNRRLSKRVGEESPEISTEWKSKTSQNLGEKFDVVRKLDAEGVPPINLKLVRSELAGVTQTGRLAGGKKIGNVEKEFNKRFPGSMSWNEYADLRSEWAKTVINSQDRDFARRLGKFIGALDNAAEKSAPKAAREFKDATTKWREFSIIRDSVDEEGDIARGLFVRAIAKMKKGKFSTAEHGEDELIDIARSLETFAKQIPSSGTAERLQAMKGIEAIGAIPKRLALGGMGFALGDIAGLGTGLAAPWLAQKALLSPALQKYLTEVAPRTRELSRKQAEAVVSKAIRAAAVLGGIQ